MRKYINIQLRPDFEIIFSNRQQGDDNGYITVNKN